jgi:hypothetical protein
MTLLQPLIPPETFSERFCQTLYPLLSNDRTRWARSWKPHPGRVAVGLDSHRLHCVAEREANEPEKVKQFEEEAAKEKEERAKRRMARRARRARDDQAKEGKTSSRKKERARSTPQLADRDNASSAHLAQLTSSFAEISAMERKISYLPINSDDLDKYLKLSRKVREVFERDPLDECWIHFEGVPMNTRLVREVSWSGVSVVSSLMDNFEIASLTRCFWQRLDAIRQARKAFLAERYGHVNVDGYSSYIGHPEEAWWDALLND